MKVTEAELNKMLSFMAKTSFKENFESTVKNICLSLRVNSLGNKKDDNTELLDRLGSLDAHLAWLKVYAKQHLENSRLEEEQRQINANFGKGSN